LKNYHATSADRDAFEQKRLASLEAITALKEMTALEALADERWSKLPSNVALTILRQAVLDLAKR
jgi:hypothetical protein